MGDIDTYRFSRDAVVAHGHDGAALAAVDQMEDHHKADQDQDDTRREAGYFFNAADAHGPGDNELAALEQIGLILEQTQVNAVGVDAEIEVIEYTLDDLTEGQRYDGQIVTVEAQHRDADEETHDSGKDSADDQRNRQTQRRRGNAVLQRNGSGGAHEGADAHKARMSQGQLTQDADR